MLLSSGLVTAQESTPTPEPTLTPAWTETPTEAPTLTPTELPTLTETPLPSPTFTEAPTLTPVDAAATVTATLPAEVTATATAESTLQPTATVNAIPTEPPLTLLVSETFDSGSLALWLPGPGWGLIPNEAGQALLTTTDAPLSLNQTNLSEAAVQARVRWTTGTVWLSLNQTASGSYEAALSADGTVQLLRAGQVLGTAQVSAQTPGQWRTLRLSAIGNLLRVSVDGAEVILAFEPSPLPAGSLTLRGTGLDAVGLTVDDVQVWLAAAALPATVTPEPTATVAPTATATPVTLPLVYSTTFDNFVPPANMLMDGWNVLPTPDGSVLTTATQFSMVSLFNTHASDAAAHIRFQLSYGAIQMQLRYSEMGSYVAKVFADGRVQLLRDIALVASAQVTPLSGSWNTLDLVTMGNTVEVRINGVTLINFQDPQPLPAGGSAIASWQTGESSVFVDDLQYWATEVLGEASASMGESESLMALESSPMMAMSASSSASTEPLTFTFPPNSALSVGLYSSGAFTSVTGPAPGREAYTYYHHAHRDQYTPYDIEGYIGMREHFSLGRPFWAPNGQYIAFPCHFRINENEPLQNDTCIGVLDLSRTNEVPRANQGPTGRLEYLEYGRLKILGRLQIGAQTVTWSPGSDALAYVVKPYDPNDTDQIFKVDLSIQNGQLTYGQAQVLFDAASLPSGGRIESVPDWRSNNILYFGVNTYAGGGTFSENGTSSGAYALTVLTNQVTQVFSLAAMQQFATANGLPNFWSLTENARYPGFAVSTGGKIALNFGFIAGGSIYSPIGYIFRVIIFDSASGQFHLHTRYATNAKWDPTAERYVVAEGNATQLLYENPQLQVIDVSSGFPGTRYLVKAVFGEYGFLSHRRGWGGYAWVSPAPWVLPHPPVSTPTSTPIVGDSCPVLRDIYQNAEFDINEGFHPAFSQYLVNPETSSIVRIDCLRLYKDIIIAAVFHELSEDTYWSMDELDILNGRTYRWLTFGNDSRVIPSDGSEIEPFNNISGNVRYMYVRSILNGMLDSYATVNSDPMRYFAKNYNSTVSIGWIGGTLCQPYQLVSLRGLPNSCLHRQWYTDEVGPAIQESYPEAFVSLSTIVDNAIVDEIMNVADPTQGAFNAKPTNRRWNNNRPNATEQPYVFSTVVGQVVQLLWTTVNGEFYPSGIWNGELIPVQNINGSCPVVSETLSQAYSRHLRESYGNTVFTSLLNGEPVTQFSRNNVKFGMDLQSIHIHALRIEEAYDANSNQDIVVAMTWFTFRFELPEQANQGLFTSPVTGSEFMPRIDGDIVQPIGCN